MKLKPVASLCKTFAVVIAMSAPWAAVAGSAAIATKPKPNLWGVWIGLTGPNSASPYRSVPWTPTPKFTLLGAAESKRWDTGDTRGECDPWSPVAYMIGIPLFPMQIVQAPNQVLILLEGTALPRRIYTDGRDHPKDLDPTWEGHSIGHWQGDTLMVDTVGTNGRTKPFNGPPEGAVTSADSSHGRLPANSIGRDDRIRTLKNTSATTASVVT